MFFCPSVCSRPLTFAPDAASTLYEQYSTAWVLLPHDLPSSLYLTRSYEVQPEASSAENLRRPLLGLLIAAAATSLFFFFAPDVRFGRGIFAIANVLFVFLLLAWRLGIFLRLRRRSLAILLMGNPAAVEMARQLIREFSPFSQTHVWQPEAESASTPARLDPDGAPTAEDEFDLLILAGHSLDPPTLRKAAALRLKGVMVWNLPRLWSEFAERLPAPLYRRTLGGHRRGFPFAQRNRAFRSSSGWWISASPLRDCF